MSLRLVGWVFALSIVAGCGKDPPPPTPTGEPARPEAPAVAPSAAATAGVAPATTVAPSASAAAAPTEAPAPSARPSSAALATATSRPAASGAPSAVASAAPSASALPDKPVEGAVAADTGYRIWMRAPGRLAAGAPARAEVVLTATGDFHCNDKYPFRLTLDAAPPGLSYPSTSVTGAAVAPAQTVLAVPFVAERAGRATISGTFSFSVCTADKCIQDKKKVSVTVDVGG